MMHIFILCPLVVHQHSVSQENLYSERVTVFCLVFWHHGQIFVAENWLFFLPCSLAVVRSASLFFIFANSFTKGLY